MPDSAPDAVPSAPMLEPRLGLSDAVIIGVGSMVGAGVFVAWSPAAQAAGNGLLVGLVIVAVIALCNASSSAQLAAVHPESGGTYVYGRRRLGPFWGYVAGWGFVVGKTASCAAMALAAGGYLWGAHDGMVAVATIVAITTVNLGGLTRTVAVTRILLALTMATLIAVLVAGWTNGDSTLDRLTPIDTTFSGVLRSAGFLFFAFAGHARIATLGEEVRNPEVTVPRAIPRALGTVLVLYLLVAVTTLAAVGRSMVATSNAPLRTVVEGGRFHGLAPVVRVGAGVASVGVLLNLIPGVSRTALAMGRRGDLPRFFSGISPNRSLPLRAELTVAATAVALVLVLDLRSAISVSGVAVLTYYASTNAAALTLRQDQRRWPRGFAVVGFVGCVALVAALLIHAIAGGAITLVIGLSLRYGLALARNGTNTLQEI